MGPGQQAHESVVAAARLALEQWSRRLGDTGIAAMLAEPGLTAQVDQHVAQIRAAVGRLHPVTLAAYADGVADAATARGWSPDEAGTAGWARPSWPSVHLLAVCVLAASAA